MKPASMMKASQLAPKAEKKPVAPNTTTAAVVFTVDSTVDSPLATSSGTTCVDSETTAKCSLRAAIEAANNLDKPVVIDLPAGTYQLTDTTDGALVVQNPAGTSIVGAGDTTTDIEGDGAGVLNAIPDGSGTPGALFLSGVKISGGTGTDGAGLTIGTNSCVTETVVLSHVLFTGNTASSYGGGIYAYCADLFASYSAFTGNTASSYGGGIYQYWSNVSLTGVTFSGNTSGGGGALFSEYGNVVISKSNLSNNTAGSSSSSGYGGAIYEEYGLETIDGSTLNHDSAIDGGGGGAIYDYFSLEELSNSTLSYDSAAGTSGYGGAISNYEAQETASGVTLTHDSTGANTYYYGGGALYLYGYEYPSTFDATNSTISGDSSTAIVLYQEYGGSNVSITDSTLDYNTSATPFCGAVICNYQSGYNGDTITLTGDTIEHNTSSAESGAGVLSDYDYYGGSTVNLTGDKVSYNTATGAPYVGSSGTPYTAAVPPSAGAIVIDNYEYASNTFNADATSFVGNSAPNGGWGGAVDLYNADDYTPIAAKFTNDTLSGNVAGSATNASYSYGGAISVYDYASLTVAGSKLVNNRALGNSSYSAEGGGIYDDNFQSTAFSNDIISGNAATGASSEGGGIYSEDEAGDTIVGTTIASNYAVYGGGAYYDSSAYQLRLLDSTVSGNKAGNSSAAGEGAGLYLGGTAFFATNSTFTGNVAVSTSTVKAEGGAIYTSSGPSAIEFSTISGNTAAEGAGAYSSNTDGGALSNDIISHNTTLTSGGTEADCAGSGVPLVSAGGNVFGQEICVTAMAPSDVLSTTPGLDALANKGGSTETMALTSSSPAIGRAVGACPATDQRGEPRLSTGCDSGAYQFAPGIITALSQTTGKAGAKVTIYGKDFTYVEKVTFGKTAVKFTKVGTSKLIVVAPKGLTGKVTVAVDTYDGHGTTKTFTYKKASIRHHKKHHARKHHRRHIRRK